MAQINPTVGDLAGNSTRILAAASKAHDAGAHLIVYPEMIVTGYPVEDLALRHTFRAASKKALQDLVIQLPPDLVAVVGYLEENNQGAPQNAVALIHGGKIGRAHV